MSKVVLSPKSHSFSVLAALNLSGLESKFKVEWSADGEGELHNNGQVVKGGVEILKNIVSQSASTLLYGDAAGSVHVDKWVQFALKEVMTSDQALANKSIAALNVHLRMRSFIVGYHVTVADLILFESLKISSAWTKCLKSKSAVESYPHLLRWFNFIQSHEVVQASIQKSEAGLSGLKKKDQASFDIDLQGAVRGAVVTRFPPEPSGYLHVGHAKAALLNEYFARHYEGKLIVRFDDTNPSKEKQEFEDSILEDLKMLNIVPDQVTHSSDYFDLLTQYAIQMIKEGNAYVDDTQQEQMRKERMDGIASKCRNLSVEENLKRFDEMLKATEIGLKCCLRAKMSVDAKNKAMRDPVIFRCNLIPHLRTGDKYKCYPTYDFCCPIIDSIEGVTHALRTNEYHDRNDQYYWFIEKLRLRKPLIWDYSRMNFVYTLLSKRKLLWFVENGKVDGWDDPRFPTIRGILRRGMGVEALREYILMQGPSKNILLLEWDKFWAVNRKFLDPIAPRHTAINDKTKVKLTIQGAGATQTKEALKHKKNPDLGNKVVYYSSSVWLEGADAQQIEDNEEITLMDWGNVIIKKIQKTGDKVTELEGVLHLEGDFKKTKKKLTWLSTEGKNIPVEIHDYDFLITKKKLEEDDDFESALRDRTEFMLKTIGDHNLANLRKGDKIQLERRGFFICDQEYSNGNPLRLIVIPDGKSAPINEEGVEVKTTVNLSGTTISASSSTAELFKLNSGMYVIPPIYDFSIHIDPKESSTLYVIEPIYGDLLKHFHVHS